MQQPLVKNLKIPNEILDFARSFEVGGCLHIWGRIQSREYIKKLSETETEKRTAYEVSVSKLEYGENYRDTDLLNG